MLGTTIHRRRRGGVEGAGAPQYFSSGGRAPPIFLSLNL